MKISSSKFQSSLMTPNESALLRCEVALELKDKGDWKAAQEAMQPHWGTVGTRPNISGLHASVAAEVTLTVGVLTCWIGSKGQFKQAHEIAKDLIEESITFFESIGDRRRIAAARVELAYCYWCEGAFDEARVLFREALQTLTSEGNTRARALLGLAIVEWSDSQVQESYRILTEHNSLFQKVTNHALKGTYHNQLAMVLTNLANSENKKNYFQLAIREHRSADEEFKLAHNVLFRADVKNNLAFLLYRLSRYKEAHQYLEAARRLLMSKRDKIGAAQIDDTRAQVYIAEKKYKEAVNVSKLAVRVLEKSGHQCLLADALVTQGIALARMKQTEHAQYTFQKAIEVAHQVGALNKAGIAALTLIEEIAELPDDALYAAYDRASEWLENSQSLELLLRLNAVSRKVLARSHQVHEPSAPVSAEDSIEALLNKPCNLPAEVLKYEGLLIQGALAKSNGSLTKAAALLSMSYQALAYIIESRQKHLVEVRSPIRRRSRKDRNTAETQQAEETKHAEEAEQAEETKPD